MSTTEALERWRHRGRYLELHGLRVFHVLEGEGTTVLLLHGFPTCGYDWSRTLEVLARTHRVLVPDLPGFGLSSKPRAYDYSLFEQAGVVAELCRRLELRSAHLVAHDMGTSVACELLARREEGTLPFTLRSLTLTNGSVYIDMARLRLAQSILRRPRLGALFARLATREVFRLQLRRLFGHRDAVPASELDLLWELLTHDDGHLRLPQISVYLDERRRYAERWHGPLRRLDVPALVLWGWRDPVAVPAIAERLAREIPTSRLLRFDTLGHYPQLEAPTPVGAALADFLAAADRSAGP